MMYNIQYKLLKNFFYLEKVEKFNVKLEELKNESDLNRASTNIVENFVAEKNNQLDSLNKEVNKLKIELKAAIKARTVSNFI